MVKNVLAAFASTGGKVATGVALAASATGGVVAADLLEADPQPVVVYAAETPGDLDADLESEVDNAAVEAEETTAETDVPAEDDRGENELVEEVPPADEEPPTDEETEEADDAEERETHGQQVSDFATSTDLKGCEKGQAIAEIASSKANRGPNADGDENDDDHDPCADRGDAGEDDADEATDDTVEADDDDETDENDGDETDAVDSVVDEPVETSTADRTGPPVDTPGNGASAGKNGPENRGNNGGK